MKAMSTRQQRVSEQIKGIVTAELSRGDFADPRIGGMICVPHVWVSPDLRQSRVYYSSLGHPQATRDEMRDLTLSLNDQAYRIQKQVSHQLTMKYTPKIHFFYDEQIGEAERIEEIFAKIGTSSQSEAEG